MLRAQVRINGHLMAGLGRTTDPGREAGRCDAIRKFAGETGDNRRICVKKVHGRPLCCGELVAAVTDSNDDDDDEGADSERARQGA